MNRGSYLLVFYLPSNKKVMVGSLGIHEFPKGWYVYVGSGMNSLSDRVKRHLNSNKRKRWHIDYLLDFAEIKACVLLPSSKRHECFIADRLSGRVLVKGFGSSDCKCESHLFYYKNLGEILIDIKRILEIIL